MFFVYTRPLWLVAFSVQRKNKLAGTGFHECVLILSFTLRLLPCLSFFCSHLQTASNVQYAISLGVQDPCRMHEHSESVRKLYPRTSANVAHSAGIGGQGNVVTCNAGFAVPVLRA